MNDLDRGEDDADERYVRLMRAVRAEADPALWTRARARLEACAHVPRLLAWAMRPAALGAAAVLLAVASGLSWTLLVPVREVTAGAGAGLVERLEAERGESGAADEGLLPGSASPRDSGAGS